MPMQAQKGAGGGRGMAPTHSFATSALGGIGRQHHVETTPKKRRCSVH